MLARSDCLYGCNGPCKMPRWVIDGWYSNNPHAERLAIIRWHRPVTTAAERAQAKRDLEADPRVKALCEKIRAERNGRQTQ